VRLPIYIDGYIFYCINYDSPLILLASSSRDRQSVGCGVVGGKWRLPGRSHESPPPSRSFSCVVREPANALPDHSDHRLSHTRFYITTDARAHYSTVVTSRPHRPVKLVRTVIDRSLDSQTAYSSTSKLARRRHEAAKPRGKHSNIL